ncbi:MAG: hypothetical protein SV765_02440 [Pseudomonadota bacterium]|nr:hypothetical protein [Pseudomonadota bacterium]
MRQLGFEHPGLPWFALLSTPPRALTYTAGHFLPGARRRQQQQGRQAQLAMLAALFGEQEPDIIKPGAGHPAHL